MTNIDLTSITEAAAQSFQGLPDARQRELAQALVRSLHQYVKDVQLTHAEWRAALGFLHKVGDTSSDSRSEFSLLSDVMGLSSLVDLLASDPSATPGSVLGPFHALGSPWLNHPANLIGANEGQRVLLRASVCDSAGQPLPTATIDFWQNAANGLYWQLDPSQPQDKLRCQLKVSAPGYRTLVTELFDAEAPYLDSDVVFGVRDALVGRYQDVTDPQACARIGLSGSTVTVMSMQIRLCAL